MTTIVVTRTAMYAESKVTTANGLSFPSNKIFRLRGSLVGTAGNNPGIEKFIVWFKGDQKTPIELAKNDSFEIIVLNRNGIFCFGNSSFPDRVLRDWHAIGEGAGPAMGAMLAGADPMRAIEIACELCNNSGPPINVYKLSGRGRNADA